MEELQHSLELDDDISLHKKGWTAQYIGWGIFYLTLILAMFGLFGNGPFSHVTKTGSSGIAEYERFLRFESESEVIFRLKNTTDTTYLTIPQSYFAYIDVLRISPLPLRSETRRDSFVYSFVTNGDVNIYVTMMAKKAGYYKGNITAGENTFPISHLIYP